MKSFFIVLLSILFLVLLFNGCAATNSSDRSTSTSSGTSTANRDNLQAQNQDGQENQGSQSDLIAFNAQYIRGSYSSSLNQGNTTVVTSMSELNPYFRTNRTNAIEKYNDNFFADNFLVIVSLIETSGSIRHEVKSVSANGDILINRLVPGIGTADMAAWSIIIELNKSFTTRQFKVSLVEVGY